MRTNGKRNNLKLIAACSVAIFSLLAVCGGVYAWFTLKTGGTVSSDSFSVVNVGSASLYSMELYKFNYSTHQYGTQYIVDYSAPESGTVEKYSYSKVHNAFGYDDGEWHSVSMMNIYDPVSLQLTGGELISLNCNSIYKFTISSADLVNARLDASAKKITDRQKENDEIFLTSCVDFDLFFQGELDAIQGDVYYPSYDVELPLTPEEEVYYRISYLSSQRSSHGNLYDSDGSIRSENVSFAYDSVKSTNILTFYVNVNYSPAQLEYTMYHIYQKTINAICDFGFNFAFVQGGNE